MAAENAGKARLPRRNASELKKLSWFCHSPSSMVSKVVGGQNMSQLKSKTALVTGASKGSVRALPLNLQQPGKRGCELRV